MMKKVTRSRYVVDGVVFAGGFMDDVLVCPADGCEGEYLHQERVDVFFREEDAESGMYSSTTRNVTIVHDDMHTDMDKNPSHRRDGIAIYFTCEQCHLGMNVADIEDEEFHVLEIVQCKGNTVIKWKNGLAES